jgi:hypothetical protein
MKNRMGRLIGVGLVVAMFIGGAAWRHAVLSIYSLETSAMSNPEGSVITVNDGLTVVGTVSATAIGGASVPVTAASLTTTGAVNIAEGQLTDSTIVSADIKNGEIVDADINASAAIAASKIVEADPIWAATSNTITAGAALGATSLQPSGQLLTRGIIIIDATGAYTGVVDIVTTTLTLVVNGTVTNVIDADITTP